MPCAVCKTLEEHPEAKCFIVDVGHEPEPTCEVHSQKEGDETFSAEDYLALNTWAGNLGEGVHYYKITG